jgi:hypothetical protein
MQRSAMQLTAAQRNAVQFSAINCSAMQLSAVQRIAVKRSTMQRSVLRYMECIAMHGVHRNASQYIAAHFDAMQRNADCAAQRSAKQRIAARCSVIQRSKVQFSTLQRNLRPMQRSTSDRSVT